MDISDLQAGKAGEYLVCADLILQGFVAFPSEQGLPYDVVAQGPSGLVKIQVKSMRSPASQGYQPPVYKVSAMQCGKGGKKRYRKDDADVFAFVSLDEKYIGYISRMSCRTCMEFRSEAHRGKYQSEQIDETCVKAIELRAMGKTFKEIGAILGVSRPQAHRYCIRNVSKGKYLRDFLFTDAVNALD